ncbi:MAG: transposase [Salinisphaera sp.]|nr:transposase [Salinisphaera sp.]
MSKYQSFSKAFKLEAVRLPEAGDKPASDIARDLGIRRNQRYKWRDQLRVKGEAAFSGKRGRPSTAPAQWHALTGFPLVAELEAGPAMPARRLRRETRSARTFEPARHEHQGEHS